MINIKGYKGDITGKERTVVEVKLDELIILDFDDLSSKITFYGFICSNYYQDYRKYDYDLDKKYTPGELVIYDYFSPSLIDYFKEGDGNKWL